MLASLAFVLKVLIPSLLIAIVICRFAPSWGLAGSDLNAVVAIVTPSLIVALVLGWRGWQAS